MRVHQVVALPADDIGLVSIPIVGHAICAGFPSPADDFLEGTLDLPRWLAPNPPATFALNVSGDSMRDEGVFDRDLVVADRSLRPGSGSVVVVIVDGALSLKKVVLDGNVLRLAFGNAAMAPYALEEFAEAQLWGVVRFNIRWHVARAARGRR
ncbi:LexA family protein [Methylobacterium iners]|uniref:Protein UmuD n=1 Tax=Methylobacterium iners TaxID=418707 RepID=A0ABQ4S5S5_9HYPH|nr:S24 family peptidase [Methylobacterium iners]GJD97843.1 Protein UmuD [Methylobacterium iners]